MKKTEFRKFKKMFDGLEYLKDKNIDKFEQWIKEHPECLEEPNFDDLEDEIDDFFGSTERRAEAFMLELVECRLDLACFLLMSPKVIKSNRLSPDIMYSFNMKLDKTDRTDYLNLDKADETELIQKEGLTINSIRYMKNCHYCVKKYIDTVSRIGKFYNMDFDDYMLKYAFANMKRKKVATEQTIQLPAKLDTETARAIFTKALEDGLIQETRGKITKSSKCSKVLLAYLTLRIYCKDIDGKDNKKPYPATALGKLFNESRLDRTVDSIPGNKTGLPGEYETVDKYFEELKQELEDEISNTHNRRINTIDELTQ